MVSLFVSWRTHPEPFTSVLNRWTIACTFKEVATQPTFFRRKPCPKIHNQKYIAKKKWSSHSVQLLFFQAPSPNSNSELPGARRLFQLSALRLSLCLCRPAGDWGLGPFMKPKWHPTHFGGLLGGPFFRILKNRLP
jgi:hypothetical protein